MQKIPEIAQELNKIKINENSRIITLDIKDLYVNLPLNGIMQAKYWLDKNNNSKDVMEQLLSIIKTYNKITSNTKIPSTNQ